MTNYPMLDDKLATLRHAIEGGVKADSMQALKLMELVDAIGEQFKLEVADASTLDLDAPAPIVVTAGAGALTDCDTRIRKWRDAFDAMHRRAMRAESALAQPSDAAAGDLIIEARARSVTDRDRKNFAKFEGMFAVPPAASGQKLTDEQIDERIKAAEKATGIYWFVPDDSDRYLWRTINTDQQRKFARALLRASDSATAKEGA
ncbi:hypothetical protein [Paraburkholderia hospita]|uniref:hypothetical protein n=1 Tax=Paraburkholderia hospita TaxID=169430 RepID=UPI003ECE1A3A